MNELVREVKTAFSFPSVFAAIGITAIVCFLLGNWYGDRNAWNVAEYVNRPTVPIVQTVPASWSPESPCVVYYGMLIASAADRGNHDRVNAYLLESERMCR